MGNLENQMSDNQKASLDYLKTKISSDDISFLTAFMYEMYNLGRTDVQDGFIPRSFSNKCESEGIEDWNEVVKKAKDVLNNY